MNKPNLKPVDFDEYLAEKLKNPEFKKSYDEAGRQLDISLQILRLRKKKRQ